MEKSDTNMQTESTEEILEGHTKKIPFRTPLRTSMVATEPSVFEKSSETDVLLIFRTFLNTFYTVKMSSDLVQIK